jgi:glutaredoxin
MKQQCNLAMIYLNWLLFAGGLTFFLFERLYVLAVAWVVMLPLAMWGYIRVFPFISQAMGYGSIIDEPEPARMMKTGPVEVRLYTALGCPFCPVVKQRLTALGERMGFQLKEIDVTLKPGLLAIKGIRTVPVVEAGDRRLVGNTTSEQLAEFISGTVAQRRAS